MRIEDGRGVGGAPRVAEERFVQQLAADLAGGRVDRGVRRELRRRHQIETPLGPRRFALAQAGEEAGEGAEHGRHQTGREGAHRLVPGKPEPPHRLGGEHLEEDLRRLHAAPHQARRGRRRGGRRRRRLAGSRLHLHGRGSERQGRREDDRHGQLPLVGAAAVELAQHPHAVVAVVRQVLPEALLESAGTACEVGAGRLDGEQQRRSEVADQLVHLGVHRQAVREEEVEGEARPPRPGRQHLGDGGAEERRGGDPGMPGAALDGCPGGRVELSLALAHLVPRTGADAGRQLGRRRQRRQAARPVLPGRGLGGAVVEPAEGQDVVAVAQRERRQPRPWIAVADFEVAHQHLRAACVADQQVARDVQALVARPEAGDAQLPERPAIGGVARREHLRPHLRRRPLGRRGAEPTQVEHRDAVGRHRRQHLLEAVAAHHRAQHVVARHHLLPGMLEARQVEILPIEFQVALGADAAQRQAGAAAHPVRLLQVGERKRLAAARRFRCHLGQLAQHVEKWRAQVGNTRPQLWRERPARRLEPQPTAFAPELNAPGAQLLEQLHGAHSTPSSNSSSSAAPASVARNRARWATVGLRKRSRGDSLRPCWLAS
jgi:hypothetical protein